MVERVVLAFALAFLASVGLTGISHAEGLTDEQVQVAVGTAIVAAASMAVLFVFYLIKRALGGFNLPPADEHDFAGHH